MTGSGRLGVSRLVRVAMAGLLVLISAAWPLAAVPAYAADELLIGSDPYEHQELTDPPSGVVLAFSRKVDAAAAQIVVTNSAGATVNINSLIVEGANVTAQVKPNLPEGTYTVHYQVNRTDGQVEGGAFQFSYGKGTWTSLPDRRWSGNTAQPSVIASAQPEPATATPSEPTAETSAATAEPTAAASSGVATGPGGADGSGPTAWLVGGGVVVLAAVAVAILAVRRRRAGRGPVGPTD